jgi:hypothetical protein
MTYPARLFVPAMLAAMLLGTVSAGAADEPVATAPIPPPLPAEPLSPATPMMIPATPPKPDAPKKSDAAGPAATEPKKKPGKKPAVEKPASAAASPRKKPATAARASQPKRSVARQETAEREAARQNAAEAAGRERYQGARHARTQGVPETAPWPSPPYDRSYNGTALYPPGPVESGPPRYYAEYPRPPMFGGPAYPPPWHSGYNTPPSGHYPDYYSGRWRGAPMPW